MISFWRRTLRGRLLSVILRTTATALLLASAVSFAFEYAKERRHLVEELGSLAGVIAANSTAALAFNDVKAAEENLAALRNHHNIVSAVLFDAAGRPFASYRQARRTAGRLLPPAQPEPEGYRFCAGRLYLSRDVREGAGRLGTLRIEADLSELATRLWLYAVAAAILVLIVGFLAYLLADRLQRAISRPVLDLAAAARRVSEERDFTVRVGGSGDDEIGRLTRAFNEMLGEIESRDGPCTAPRTPGATVSSSTPWSFTPAPSSACSSRTKCARRSSATSSTSTTSRSSISPAMRC